MEPIKLVASIQNLDKIISGSQEVLKADKQRDASTENPDDTQVAFIIKPDTDNEAKSENEKFTTRSHLIGASLSLLSSLCYTLSAVSAQFLEGEIPDAELTVIRAALSTPFIIIYIGCRKLPWLPSNRKTAFWYLLDSFIAAAWMYIFYFGIKYISLASAECIFISTSLVGTAILCKLVLKQDVGIIKVLAILLCCVGLTLLVQPDFLFSKDSDPETELQRTQNMSHVMAEFSNNGTMAAMNSITGKEPYDTKENDSDSGVAMDIPLTVTSTTETYQVIMGYVAFIVCGIITSVGVLLKIGTTLKHYNPFVWLLWNGLFTVTVVTVIMFIVEEVVMPSSWASCLILLVFSITSFNMTVFYYAALKFTSGVIVVLVGTMTIIFNLIAQYAMGDYIKPGHRNALEIVGAITVFIGALMPSVVLIIQTISRKQRK